MPLYATSNDAVPTAVPHHVYLLRYSHSRLITTTYELLTRKATFVHVVPSRQYLPSLFYLRRRRLVVDYASTLQLITTTTTATYIYRQLIANNTRARGVECLNLSPSGIGPYSTRFCDAFRLDIHTHLLEIFSP
jgi:hypothetical protein